MWQKTRQEASRRVLAAKASAGRKERQTSSKIREATKARALSKEPARPQEPTKAKEVTKALERILTPARVMVKARSAKTVVDVLGIRNSAPLVVGLMKKGVASNMTDAVIIINASISQSPG